MNVFADLLNVEMARKVIIFTLLFLIIFVTMFAFMLVPKRAQAFLGIGDFSFTSIVVDIPRVAWQILQTALVRFLTNILNQALKFVLGMIKKNFLVRNFLRYEALLTNRRYLDDYLILYFSGNQHVSTRALLKRYVAAVNSRGLFVDTSLASELKNRADDARGYRVEDLDPSDPNYLAKLTRQADIFSSPTAWYFLLQDQSLKAESEAQKASSLSLTSEGLKNSFTESGGSVIRSSQSEVISLYRGATDAIFDHLGGSGGTIIKTIGNVIRELLTQFVSSEVLSGYVGNEFSDFLNPNENPWDLSGGLCSPGQICPVPINPLEVPKLPSIPDFCAASVSGGAATDLGTGSASATGGSGGSGGSDLLGGSTGGSGGTGGNAEVTLDLQNDEGLTASPSAEPCAGYASQGEAQDQLDDLIDSALLP